MSLSLLIIDRRPVHWNEADGDGSTLLLPVGVTSLLDHIVSAMQRVVGGRVAVMPMFPLSLGYEAEIHTSTSAAITVIAPDQLPAFMARCEQSDAMLTVDVARFPLEASCLLRFCQACLDYRGASFLIALRGDGDRVREWVECDGQAEVKRIHRSYDSMVWPESTDAATVALLAPAPVIRHVRFTCVNDLRPTLGCRGVLSQDVPVLSDLVDLTDQEGFLAFQEAMLAGLFSGSSPSKPSGPAPLVYVGEQCSIHPSVRLVGPAVIQSHTTLEEGVTVVGPAVIGSGSRVGAGATLATAVVPRHATVPGGATFWHSVVTRPGPQWSQGRRAGLACAPALRVQSSGNVRARQSMRAVEALSAGRCRWLHVGLKRALDFLLALASLIFLSPLLIVVSVLVKLDTPGPVLFAHQRERRNGRSFPCWKFRTMVQDAHRQQRELYANNEVDGPQFKIRDDPRVTRVGRWLRTTNIDELPQLFNVLLGHMSLVGPRPSPFRENQICVPWRNARLSVPSGITGLWQLCRDKRIAGDFHQWIYYDLVYVRHFSIWLDVKILLATVLTLGGMWRVSLSWLIRDP